MVLHEGKVPSGLETIDTKGDGNNLTLHLVVGVGILVGY
jgi:hypothetical protein